jgi:hypothetical protein
MVRRLRASVIVVFGLAALTATVHADVQLTIRDGRVSLVAKDATVAQILAEWSRVGQTRIVNGERVPGGQVNLELKDVPEDQALEVLLRSASGYMAAPRPASQPGGSRYDRILVMPTSAAPRGGAAAAPPPQFAQPQFNPPPPADDEPDDEPPAGPLGRPARGPVFNAFPQPQGIFPPGRGAGPGAIPPQTFGPESGGPEAGAQTPAGPGGGPTPAPIGVSTPGMVVPAPAPPPGQQPGFSPGQPRSPGD